MPAEQQPREEHREPHAGDLLRKALRAHAQQVRDDDPDLQPHHDAGDTHHVAAPALDQIRLRFLKHLQNQER
jgi:hypothetical protein